MQPHLQDKLRQILNYAVSAVLAADTIRSVWHVKHLTTERLKEWEEEDNEQLVKEMTAVLKGVAKTCQAKNPDFWPTAANNLILGPQSAAAIAAAATQEEEHTTVPAAATILDQLLLSHSAAATNTPTPSHQTTTTSTPTTASLQTTVKRHRIVVVTLDDVLDHLSSTLSFFSPNKTVASSRHQHITTGKSTGDHIADDAAAIAAELEHRVNKTADAWKGKLQNTVPWPEMKLVRRSALRYTMEFQGLRYPGGQEESVEKDLSVAESLGGGLLLDDGGEKSAVQQQQWRAPHLLQF